MRLQFQSTLPRRERQFNGSVYIYGSSISIHAPAKGATYLANGETNLNIDFNPRSREGSDTVTFKQFWEVIISIHAPAKGATRYIFAVYSAQTDFNPRSREGSDVEERKPNYFLVISIHAPAKGATYSCVHGCILA